MKNDQSPTSWLQCDSEVREEEKKKDEDEDEVNE